MRVVYFQPPTISPKYCEVGTIQDNDPDYIWYMYAPYKILISKVKIIPKEQVKYNKREDLYIIEPKN